MGPYYVAARPMGAKRWERAGREGDYICITNRILHALFFDGKDDAQKVADGINSTEAFEAEVRKNPHWSKTA